MKKNYRFHNGAGDAPASAPMDEFVASGSQGGSTSDTKSTTVLDFLNTAAASAGQIFGHSQPTYQTYPYGNYQQPIYQPQPTGMGTGTKIFLGLLAGGLVITATVLIVKRKG